MAESSSDSNEGGANADNLENDEGKRTQPTVYDNSPPEVEKITYQTKPVYAEEVIGDDQREDKDKQKEDRRKRREDRALRKFNSRVKLIKVDGLVPRKVNRTEAETKLMHSRLKLESWIFGLGIFCFQVWLIIVYAIWIRYLDDTGNPGVPPGLPMLQNATAQIADMYGYFRDVNIMIFFGFGFLMTFLRRYGYSAIGYTLGISALIVQWSVPLNFFVYAINNQMTNRHGFIHYYQLGVYELTQGLFCAGAAMISFGAIIGKTTPLQLLIIAFLEPLFYWLNQYLIIFKINAVDIGGGMGIHTFGCYFGLTVSLILSNYNKVKNHPDNMSTYNSDIFSFAGTLFLWLLWPSFNAATTVPGAEQMRAIANTFLSILSSVIITFALTRLLTRGKFDVMHMQNSVLAGGVAMGVAAHLNITPSGAMGTGAFVAVVSVCGYHFLTPFLFRTIGLHDTCGINNLHGMPGIIGAILGILATIDSSVQLTESELSNKTNQPAIQLAALGITLAIGIIGGAITGGIMKLAEFILTYFKEDLFNDRIFWMVPTDYEFVVNDSAANHESNIEFELQKIHT